MELELRHLRAVRAIADAGSLTRAAVVLGVSQPALTAQLRRIERELGGRLFERGRHGAVLTPLGEFVCIRARAVLLGVDELRRGPDPVDAGVPAVSVGGVAAAVSIGLADRIGAYLGDTEVRVHTDYSPRLLWDLLVEGRLDVGAIVDYPGYELQPRQGLRVEPIALEPIFVALWADHPLADREEVELADLAGQAWALTPPDGAGWPECFYAACRRAGFTPVTPHRVSDAAPIRQLVATRRAVSPCQAFFGSRDGVVVRPLAGSPIHMRHLLVWRDDGPLTAHTSTLLRLGQDAYREYAQKSEQYVAWLRRHGYPDPTSALRTSPPSPPSPPGLPGPPAGS